MHFFNVNEAKISENDVKIASNKLKGLESGEVHKPHKSSRQTPQIQAQWEIHIWDVPLRNQWMLFHVKMT